MSTSKTGTTESSEESHATPTEQPRPKVRRPRKDRTYKPKAPDLVQDADVRFHTHLFFNPSLFKITFQSQYRLLLIFFFFLFKFVNYKINASMKSSSY